MGERRSRIANDPSVDASVRPTVPGLRRIGRYRFTTDDEHDAHQGHETIPESGEHVLTAEERMKNAQFAAIKLLRKTLSGK